MCVKYARTKFLGFSRYMNFMSHLNYHMIIHKISEYSSFLFIFSYFLLYFNELITKK